MEHGNNFERKELRESYCLGGMCLHLYQNYVNRIQSNPSIDFMQLRNCIQTGLEDLAEIKGFSPKSSMFALVKDSHQPYLKI